MAITAINRKRKVQKRTLRFKRHHSDRYDRVGESWRKPRGIDSAVRRQFRGTVRMVKVGYKNAKATRHTLRDGFKKFLIRNINDVELLLMSNRQFCGEIAHNVGANQRIAICNRARELNVKLTNHGARVRKAPVE